MLKEWLTRLRFLVFPKPSRDLDEELQFHLEQQTSANIASGMSAAEARRQAILAFGGVERARAQAYRQRPGFYAETLLKDVRYALRQLYNAPVFTTTSILTLALAIGANTAIFSIISAILRHPAGVDHPERVAVLHVRYSQFNLDIPYVSVPYYITAASMRPEVESAAIESGTSFNIMHDNKAEHIAAARVSWRWFQVFGATPILGRTFTAEEDQPNAAPVAVLSYGLWQRDFGGRRDAIGRTVMLDQKAYRILGIMRSDFTWPRGDELWTPIQLPASAALPGEFFNENYHAFVRLRAGVPMQHFNAVLATKSWNELRSGGGSPYATSSGWGGYSDALSEFAAGPLRKPLYMIFSVVLLILLIASANVAGLLLARSSARSREFAIRTALGASVFRMTQQLLIETALLAGCAAAVGVASGPLLGRLLLLLVPAHLADGYIVRFEPVILGFTVCTMLLSCLSVGLGPITKMLADRRQPQLAENSRSATASADKQSLRSVFVIGQVAITFLMLTGTGLFLSSFQTLQHVDPGFNPAGILAARVDYAGDDFKKSQARQASFIRGAVEAAAAQPGVRAAAAVEPLPFDPGAIESSSFDIEGRPRGPNDPGPHSRLTYTTPGYLKVMQIPLLAGRWLDSDDRKDAPRVVVVDQQLAHKYWPNKSPLGEHIDSGPGNSWATVIGVVSNIRSGSLEENATDGMRYYPFAQVADSMTNILVRTDGNPRRMAAGFSKALASVDPSQTVTSVTAVETLVSDSLAARELIVWLLAAFAGLALLLASIGIYGLISYVTAQRTGEIGIRIALGAQRGNIAWLVLRRVLRWVSTGMLAGLFLSLASVALLRHFFVAFGTGIGFSLVAAVFIFLAVGALACLLPARRAALTDPMQALRME